MRRLGASLILIAGIFAGCSATVAPATEPPAAGATDLAASSTVGAEPTEQPDLTEPPPSPCAPDGSGAAPCTLAAGAYTTSAFSVTLPSPWLKWAETSAGGELYPATGASGGIHWMVNPHLPLYPNRMPGTAADIRAAMATTYEDATASEVTATRLGGTPAETFDLALGDNDPTEYLAVDSSNFRLGPGEKVRFIVAKHGADTVVIVLDAFSSADFDDVLALTKPLLDSLAWS